MANLIIGMTEGGGKLTLPADLTDKKIAVVAQSKKGKTYGLGVILEELVKANRPWIASDPADQLWGLRVRPDGTPSGLPVLLIGGPQADLPLEKHQGERMAEALLSEPVCAILDTAYETMGTVRHFMTDFAGRLMRTKPDGGRIVILEECPVLIPQHAIGGQMQACKSAVLKLLTIGGNFGYGVICASQRPATIDKDALSQCEALIVMGITHKADRRAIADWMEAKDIGEKTAKAFAELGSLTPGEAWLWWPGEDLFTKFTFRKRETLHPREMQKLGLKASAVQLGDAQRFLERVKKELTKTSATVCTPPKNPKTARALEAAVQAVGSDLSTKSGNVNQPDRHIARQLNDQAEKLVSLEKDLADLRAENKRLQENVATEVRLRRDATLRLEAVRNHLRPEYEALQKLFSEIGEASSPPAGGEIGEAWVPWLAKAATVGCRGMLEILIKKGRIKQVQLATLAGVKFGGSTWRKYRGWMTGNHLASLDNDEIEAVRL